MSDLKEIREDIGQSLAEIGNVVTEHKSSTDAAIATNCSSIEELKSNLERLEAQGNRLPSGGAPMSKKSLGCELTTSDSFDHYVKNGGRGSMSPIDVGSFTPYIKQLTSGVGSGAAAVAALGTETVSEMYGSPARQTRVRDLLPASATGAGAVEFVQETDFFHLAATLHNTDNNSGAAGQEFAEVPNTSGFFVGQAVQLHPTGNAVQNTTIAGIGTANGNPQLEFAQNIANSLAVGDLITSDEFEGTPETNLKPNADVTFNLVTEPVKTLAHGLPASRQVLDDVAGLRSHVDTRLLEGLALNQERQILYGDGSANQLNGILSNAGIQTLAWSAGVAGDLQLDAIRRAITLASMANFPVDGIIINPQDWEAIELSKGTDGHYIWVSVGEGAATRIWRANVIVTTAINQGDVLIGAFGLGASLWDREQSSIRVAEQHEDFFQRNMVYILAEERLALTIYRPEAFVHLSLDAAP